MTFTQLQQARALDLPSREAMLHRAPSVQQFWSSNNELLSNAWSEWEASEKDNLFTLDDSLLDAKLRSAVTQAWENPENPDPLPMPLQTMVGEPALAIVSKQATLGHEGAKKLDTYWVGQGIGLVNETISAGQTVQKFKEEFIEGYERMNSLFD